MSEKAEHHTGAMAVPADIRHSDTSIPWYRKPHLLKLNISIICLVLFSSALGYDGSMSNGLQALPQWNEFMEHPTGEWLGFINAIYWVAFGLASPVFGWAANRWGRKPVVYFSFLPLLAGTALEAASSSPSMFIVGRTILGIPSAAWGSVIPLLIAECAHPDHRGVLTSLYMTGFYIGSSVAAWATFAVRNYPDSWAWRVPCILQVLCPVLGFPGFFLCPESPRWMISKGRNDEARELLISIHGGGISSDLVEQEYSEIATALSTDMAQAKVSYWDMFRGRANLRRSIITISLGIYSQWVGNGVVAYYLALVLTTIGITSVTEQTLISGCLQIWNLIFAVGAALMVEKTGRRKLFMSSFVIMFISYVVITACSGTFAQTGQKSAGLAVIPFLYIFYAGYDIGLTPLQVSYPVEIWPYHMRSHGVSLSWLSMVLAIIFNVFVNPIALDAIGWKYYIVFIVVLSTYGLMVYFVYPETRGLSLEQMEVIFEAEPSAKQVNDAEQQKPKGEML
ncbi:related to hexose transporter protein [Fusarium oxysporum]|uniref:Related to hexose transporter protein n=1 Tax=Fusarium oxysporum TaxID=5507 RepID=A0A2H3TRW7_FUSOX|nr:related to hexose transporter protein [Fusarium oxysporum]